MAIHYKTLSLALAATLAWPLIAATGGGGDYFRTAPTLVSPEKAAIYGAGQADKRIVAVGDYGLILLSDDGKAFRQAKVPTRAPLTSVYFLDARRGWAVGHDGTVIGSDDGGENWQLLRELRGQDQVLMSVWFENADHGLAVGQFGLALETRDGGKTWQERSLVGGEAGERHFLQLVPAGKGLLFAAAEAGTILRSEDAGDHWQTIQTDNKGSFWTGAALGDGTLLMAGMRGHVYRSEDQGLTWKEVASGTQQSLTGIAQRSDGSVRIVGLSGTSLVSRDGGKTFVASVRPDRTGMTAIATGGGSEVTFTVVGQVLRD